MKKKYIRPIAFDIYSQDLLQEWEEQTPSVKTDSTTRPSGTQPEVTSKRNVFVFGDDSSLLPTVSMDD